MKRLLLAVCLMALAIPLIAAKPAAAPWFVREKVRCLAYLPADAQGAAWVPQVRAMGFNCALVQGGVPAADNPLLLAADKAGLRLIFTSNFLTREYLAAHPEQDRRFQGSDGRVAGHIPCPTDPRFWEHAWASQALPLAKLRRAGHPGALGLLLDNEDYANMGDLMCGSLFLCYCDRCFAGFTKSQGRLDTVPRAERQAWLTQHGLAAAYHDWQDRAVRQILAGIRRQIDAVAPDVVLATYPWIYVPPQDRPTQAAWDLRFAAGLGTARAPFMCLDERTYIWGYGPEFEREEADVRAQGVHILPLTGFNVIPAERLWWPEQMVDSAWAAATRSGGYWVFLGDMPLLRAPAGMPLYGVFGDTAAKWVAGFTAMNRLLDQGGKWPSRPLATRPIEEWHYPLQQLNNPAHSPGTTVLVRRWTDIGLPWEGGELVTLGKQKGDWLSFERNLRADERYELSLWLTRGPKRPIVQLEVDGKPIGQPIDLYQPVTTPGERQVIAYADLPGGGHTFKLVAVGRNPKATGWEIGLRAFEPEEVGRFPTEWNVIGVWDNSDPGHSAYDTVFPPEQGIDLAATYPGKGGQPVRWRRVAAQENGYLNLLPALSERKDVIAYCLTYVWSPTAGPRTVMLGSDDGGKLFVNGQWVWGEDAPRSAERDQNLPRAQFRQGWNEVLFKVTQTKGEWGIYLRVEDPKHELRYAPEVPKE